MTVSGINSAQATQSTTAPTGNAQISKLQTQFLKLLVAQLKNQDPTAPTDASAFMSQMSQLYSLQQGSVTNDNLSSISSLLKSNSNGSALSYLDKAVDISSNQAPVQKGVATWNYALASNTTDVTLTITDATGNVISTGPGDGATGTHVVTYNDTKNSALTLTVTAKDKAGATITSVITAKATVDGVDTSSGNTLLTAGGLQFSPTDILRIKSTSAS